MDINASNTTFTGTTKLSGGTLNVSASNTTFGNTEISSGTLDVLANASNTTFGKTEISGGSLLIKGNTTFGATTLANGNIHVVPSSTSDPASAIFASLTKGTGTGGSLSSVKMPTPK